VRILRSALWTAIAGGLALSACGGTPQFSAEDAATAIAATVAAIATAPEASPTEVSQAETPEAHTLPPTSAPSGPPSLTVVYTDGGNVALVGDSLPPTFLTGSGHVETVHISDDGQKIAYSRRPVDGAPVELHIINRDGSGDSIAMSPTDFDSLYPLDGALHNDLSQFGFLPGTHLLLLNTRPIFEGPGSAKRNDLIRIDADTLARTMLLAPGSGGDFAPSPDGHYLAITRPDTIEIRLADGSPSGSGVINYAPVITYSEYSYYALPVWRADSALVGSAIPSSDPLTPPTSGSQWTLVPGGTASLAGTIGAQFFLFGTGFSPLISPDLTHVAYTRATTTPNVWSLYVSNLDGSGETLAATGNLVWGGWSIDGQHFVYSMGDPKNLQVSDLTGAASPLVNGTSLRWFNPTEFVFLSGDSGSWGLQRGGTGSPGVLLASPSGVSVAYDLAYE
jgi:hypothetical protein